MNACERRTIIRNEWSPNLTQHVSGCASLAAIGVKVPQLTLCDPIRSRVHSKQKTIKHTPLATLSDARISLLAGAHGVVEIKTRLRADPGVQRAFGRTACAEQSVVQETLKTCTAEHVTHRQHALDEIVQQHSQRMHHDFQEHVLVLDVEMSGMPCGPQAAFATAGDVAGHDHRRGRPLGRVLATPYDDVVLDRLFAGNVQLLKAVQPLVEAAETTMHLGEAKRRRTMIRVDAGAGTLDDLNGLLTRGDEVMAKESSGKRVFRLADLVTQWVQDPDWPERSLSWVTEPASGEVRPVKRLGVRRLRKEKTLASGMLIGSLTTEQVLTLLGRPRAQATDPVAVLTASVTLYDQRAGGIETSFTSDKQGLGITSRHKQRVEAPHIVALLGSLAHHVGAWARRWLTIPQIQHYGGLRMVRDVFPSSGLLRFDARANLVALLLNQDALLARWLLQPLQEVLTPFRRVAPLGET